MNPLNPQTTSDDPGKSQVYDGASHIHPRKALVGAFGFLLMAATLAPVAQNWLPNPQDSFPFSYYPMFNRKRRSTYTGSYIVGLDAQGKRYTIPYTLIGTGGHNQTRRQIDALVREKRADLLCRITAGNVASDAEKPYSQIITLRVLRGEFRIADYFNGNKAPFRERVRASCQVPRSGPTRMGEL